MATNLPSCFITQFLEQLLTFLLNFTLSKYVKSQRSYGFLITKELIIGFQILDLKDHFSKFLGNVNNLVLKGSYAFHVDILINVRGTAVKNLKISIHLYLQAAMLVG